MFERLVAFFSTANNVGKFKRLIKSVSTTGPSQGKSAALEELAVLMVQRPGIATALNNYDYSSTDAKNKLIELYWLLMKGGAGQSINGRFVPAVVFYDPQLLNQLLNIERANTENYRAVVEKSALAALDYVEAGTQEA